MGTRSPVRITPCPAGQYGLVVKYVGFETGLLDSGPGSRIYELGTMGGRHMIILIRPPEFSPVLSAEMGACKCLVCLVGFPALYAVFWPTRDLCE